MKGCHKWMLLCVIIAVLIAFAPRFGWQITGGGLILTLLMFGCCVLPMLMMAFSSKKSGKGSCCGGAAGKDGSAEAKATAETGDKTSCH